VNHAKRTGRGLKFIKSGEEWRTWQGAINLDKEINDPSDEEEHPSDENDPVLVGADDTVPDKNTKDTPENGDEESRKAASEADGANEEKCINEKQESKIENKEEAEVEVLEEHVDDNDVSVESYSDEESSLASSDDDSAELNTSIPDIDDVNAADWKLPELRDYLGGDEGAEKVVFFIHAISVASVGLLLSLGQ
jgi:hypothetical protein